MRSYIPHVTSESSQKTVSGDFLLPRALYTSVHQFQYRYAMSENQEASDASVAAAPGAVRIYCWMLSVGSGLRKSNEARGGMLYGCYLTGNIN
jgi:hypothetical protein